MPHPAIVLTEGSPYALSYTEVALPPLAPGEVTLQVAYAALNRRDEWIRQGKYPGIVPGTVLGSDGAGSVTALGPGVDPTWLGRQVLVNPNLGWGPDPRAQAKGYTILGMPRSGTLQHLLNVPTDRLHPIPAHLSQAQAAALPLAGMTAYRATRVKGEVGPGQRVLVTGVGGGVALLAAQIAQAAGAELWVTTGGADKVAAIQALGFAQVIDYRAPDWAKQTLQATGGFDVVIDSAMGPTANTLIDLTRPGGRIIFYGATLGRPAELNAHKLFWNQVRLEGSTMASDDDFTALLAFVREHRITPQVHSLTPLAHAEAAFDLLKVGGQVGKLVIEVTGDG